MHAWNNMRGPRDNTSGKSTLYILMGIKMSSLTVPILYSHVSTFRLLLVLALLILPIWCYENWKLQILPYQTLVLPPLCPLTLGTHCKLLYVFFLLGTCLPWLLFALSNLLFICSCFVMVLKSFLSFMALIIAFWPLCASNVNYVNIHSQMTSFVFLIVVSSLIISVIISSFMLFINCSLYHLCIHILFPLLWSGPSIPYHFNSVFLLVCNIVNKNVSLCCGLNFLLNTSNNTILVQVCLNLGPS